MRAKLMLVCGQNWCVTEGMCGSSLGDGQFFDTCAIPTTRGCSCRRNWMTKVPPRLLTCQLQHFFHLLPPLLRAAYRAGRRPRPP